MEKNMESEMGTGGLKGFELWCTSFKMVMQGIV